MESDIINTGKRFVIQQDGIESWLEYRQKGEIMDLYSTYVPTLLKGQGMAANLILHGIHYAVLNGLRVKPSCPAVIRFLELNREWAYLSVYSLN